MLELLFVSVVEASLSVAAIAALLLVCMRFFPNSVRAMYWAWPLMALRLLIPVRLPVFGHAITISISDMLSGLVTAGSGQSAQAFSTNSTVVSGSVTIFSIVAAVWIVTSAVLITRLAIIHIMFRRQMDRWSSPCEDERVIRIFREMCVKLAIPNPSGIRLMISREVHSPLQFGVFHPLIVLPKQMYMDSELVLILKHELIHVKHHDMLLRYALILARAIHWFNPAVYFIERKAVFAAELHCDEIVTSDITMEERRQYGDLLLSLATQSRDVHMTAGFSTGGKSMKIRLNNIFDRNKVDIKRPLAWLSVAVICLVMAIGGSFVIALPIETSVTAPGFVFEALVAPNGSGISKISPNLPVNWPVELVALPDTSGVVYDDIGFEE
jgi:beta-lactamase regulating signal transducer with metallopeptidase domain